MTDSDIVLSDDVFQSFSQLRLSVYALSCAASLIPIGGSDEELGYLFRALSSCIESDLEAHLDTLFSPRS
ncbi:hypothetical protein OFY53_003497 [Salmonella enterica]|nr:hypothetical protein [Salmonella enterica]EKP2174933.1 hypothetical protein [Salmonella enterica]EKP2179484.1 hypothetical protein [Salmonella enterica]